MTGLLLIALCAAIAPVIGMRIRVPGMVLEIALGVVIGRQVLGRAVKDEIIGVLSQIGLAMLMWPASRCGRRPPGGSSHWRWGC